MKYEVYINKNGRQTDHILTDKLIRVLYEIISNLLKSDTSTIVINK